MGSHVYAAECAARGERITGMWSLETLGSYSTEPHSQRYPAPFDLFYPTTATFVAFVGDETSMAWIHRSISAFRRIRPGFPSEGVAAPTKSADINRSDNWGFWQAGYPALMVTDTANFRSDAYHTPADTPEKVNFRALARLANVLHETLKELSKS
jgi:Zn-dependent M28 family amino/carboxypeptidase